MTITSDKWVLETIQGYRIVFDNPPYQKKPPNKISFNDYEKILIDNEVENMLKDGAITPTVHESNEFISNIFLVPKPNGEFRPIINLRSLNEFVHYQKFKQETFPFVLELVQPNDFFTSLDLKKAYWSIPIDKQYFKYLKFEWRNKLYNFVCLCFGLSSAPYCFTKVLKPVYAFFRKMGIRCSYYIDDSINMHGEKEICRTNMDMMSKKLESLGFLINDEKSVKIPTQRITYFGYIIDSVLFMVFLPENKICKVKKFGEHLLTKKLVKIRDLASFIGLIISTFFAILEGPLHYRTLERCKVQALKVTTDFESIMTLDEKAQKQIHWWVMNIGSKNGRKIRPDRISFTIQTDASCEGYGSFFIDTKQASGGRWSSEESFFHINYLELLAIFFALKTWLCNNTCIHVAIQSDSTTAISYINNMGGMNSEEMDKLTKKIWKWCIKRDIYLSAFHLPGICNIQADYFSRNFSDTSEWKLKTSVTERLFSQLMNPNIDVFASRLNKQLANYVSWTPDPEALYTDAFSLDWSKWKPYIFPPFRLLGMVLNKIKEDQVKAALLICPLWPNQTWFPLFLDSLVSIPVRLPRHKDLLTLPHNNELHPMKKHLQLVGAIVSGENCRILAFRKWLSTQSFKAGGQEQENSTHPHGHDGICGVISGCAIPLNRLKVT